MEKNKRIDGEGGKEYFAAEEKREAEQQAREEARLDMRNELIRRVMTHPEIQDHVNQRQIGEAVGLSQNRISQILSDA